RLGRIQGTEGVVQYAFGNIALDHGHVLVGGGVINGVDFPVGHHVVQPPLVAYGTHDGNHTQVQAFVAHEIGQFLVNAVQTEFGVLEQYQYAWRGAHNLAAQLRSYRTTRASHHDHLIAYAALE